MNLSRSNYSARFYVWSFGKSVFELPDNFCQYFWYLIAALVFLPVTIWSLFPDRIFRSDFTGWNFVERLIAGALTLAGFLLATLAVVKSIEYPAKFLEVLFVLITILAVLASVILLIIGTIWLKEETFASEVIELLSEKKYSIKNKYCPKITWK